MTCGAATAQAKALEDLKIRIDGPFGAPAVAYARFRVVLLVGAGVGVTPFLSMVRAFRPPDPTSCLPEHAPPSLGPPAFAATPAHAPARAARPPPPPSSHSFDRVTLL